MFSNQNLQKICKKYYCEYCHYSTSRKSSYDEHILSTKHQKSMIGNQNLHKICNEYVCLNCNKKYKDNSGDNDAEKEDKIVRNIVKNVVVDK